VFLKNLFTLGPFFLPPKAPFGPRIPIPAISVLEPFLRFLWLPSGRRRTAVATPTPTPPHCAKGEVQKLLYQHINKHNPEIIYTTQAQTMMSHDEKPIQQPTSMKYSPLKNIFHTLCILNSFKDFKLLLVSQSKVNNKSKAHTKQKKTKTKKDQGAKTRMSVNE